MEYATAKIVSTGVLLLKIFQIKTVEKAGKTYLSVDLFIIKQPALPVIRQFPSTRKQKASSTYSFCLDRTE